MTPINFKANFLKTVYIPHTTNKGISEKEVSIVELDKNDKKDIDALTEIAWKWEGCASGYAFEIYNDAKKYKPYPDVYKEFVEDLKRDDDYQIVIDDPNNEYEIINVSIYIYEFNESLDYHYQLKFYYEDRNYGYCECTPDMPDYREDKHCCGHGCDATFCRFEFKKVLNVFGGGWEGDEHDYWDFEDEFYMNDKELADKKDKEETERKIRELQERISADSKKLAELTSDFPMDIDEELDKYKKTIEFMKKIGI